MHLFRMYWQRTLRRPGSVVIWLAVPFVFMAIYTLVFGRDHSGPPRTTMAVVDQDSSLVSRLVTGALRQGPIAEMIEVVDARDTTAVEEMFRGEKASAALVIPKGLGERILRGDTRNTLTLYRNPRHYIGPQIAEGIARCLTVIGDGLLLQFHPVLAHVNTLKDKPSLDEIGAISQRVYSTAQQMQGLSALRNIDVSIVEMAKDKQTSDFNLAALFFPGLVMFGLLSVALNLEHRFLHDRTHQVTRRFVIAPVSPWSIAIQQRLYTASFAFVVGMVAGVLGGLIWRIPPHGLGTATLIIVALALFISGYNGIVFSLSGSTRAVSAISSISMVFLALVGGGFFPIESTPAAFQSVTKLIPTGMVNLGLTHCLTGRPLGISMTVLFLTCGGFFAAGAFACRRRIA